MNIMMSAVPSNLPVLPVGHIQAWSVSTAVPDGWAICDGSKIDDICSKMDGETLPDMRGKTLFDGNPMRDAFAETLSEVLCYIIKVRREMSPLEMLAMQGE